MNTLLIMCYLKLNDGAWERVRGHEFVGRSKAIASPVSGMLTEGLLVQFTEKLERINGPHTQYVPNTDCKYLEDPTIVSRHPERFYSKFIRDCGPEADKIRRENPELSWVDACNRVGYNIKSMFVDANNNEVP